MIFIIVYALSLPPEPKAAEVWPRYLDRTSAAIHMTAASEAAKHLNVKDGGMELLLAMAFVESRFDPTATSRVVKVDGRFVRAVGSWPHQTPAGMGPWFCGVLQTMAYYDWKKCLEMRDIAEGYRLGVEEMNKWLKTTRGNVLLALNGHGCGNAGLTNGCNGYGARVLEWARRLKPKAVS